MTVDDTTAVRLNEILAEASHQALNPALGEQFSLYYKLYERWNQHINLSAIRDKEGVLRRHFAESILAAEVVPAEVKTLLDFGSGAGFPGIPLALCRPQIDVTLAESQLKKAGFLQEVVRSLGLSAEVFCGRAEHIGRSFDCVTLRAVDDMDRAVKNAVKLAAPGGWLLILTTEADAVRWPKLVEGVEWQELTPLRIGISTLPLLGRKSGA
jgi:16S rRNA (guanine527-N7)-methyltransferase